MKQVINHTQKKDDDREKTAVLRMEMDYELATLFEAMLEWDVEKIYECKQKLEKIRLELIRLKAFK
ncbi:MAG TPA: hypothetical protein VJ558_01730 [Bacillales bacterium]|nr:hypothetical protein [Bacillales bacterium]